MAHIELSCDETCDWLPVWKSCIFRISIPILCGVFHDVFLKIRCSAVVDRLRVHARFLRLHVTLRLSTIRLEEARWKRSQSISGGRSSRKMQGRGSSLPRTAAPCAACNRRGTHIGSLILPVDCLVAPLHRSRPSRKPAPRESACFVAAHAGPRVARACDDIEIYDRRRNRREIPRWCGSAVYYAEPHRGRDVSSGVSI